jgi:hypothetical protein
MFIDFNEMPPHSRIWIYQSDRQLTGDEAIVCMTAATEFLSGWAAHGQSLKSSAKVFYNRFLVISVDEQAASASGCSIDACVHFVQSLGSNLGVDFFNRQQIAYIDNGEVVTTELSKLSEEIASGNIQEETKTFNNLVPDKNSFDSEWICEAKDTWIKRYFKKQEPHRV